MERSCLNLLTFFCLQVRSSPRTFHCSFLSVGCQGNNNGFRYGSLFIPKRFGNRQACISQTKDTIWTQILAIRRRLLPFKMRYVFIHPPCALWKPTMYEWMSASTRYFPNGTRESEALFLELYVFPLYLDWQMCVFIRPAQKFTFICLSKWSQTITCDRIERLISEKDARMYVRVIYFTWILSLIRLCYWSRLVTQLWMNE